MFDQNKLINFKGQNITGVTFHFAPYVIENISNETHQSKFSGFEPAIIETIFNSLNAKLILNNPKSGYQWVGAVNDVLGLNCTTNFQCDGKADFGFGNMFDM